MKVFIVDVAKCNGCYSCQLVCKDEHVDNDWTPYAKPQPDTGHFWMKVHEKVHGQVPKVKLEYVAAPCMHCDDAPCIKVAKDKAVYKRKDGLVIIDPQKAKGQQQIVDVCPYDAIYWNEDSQLPQKCTGCAHLVDEGREPRCVDACATGALQFGEESDFKELIAQAEVMKPEYGLQPRVYYLNLPKLFIAGEVYDPELDECLSGAVITLTNEVTGAVMRETTDHFGDYWFRKLSVGSYSLKVSKEGYQDFTMPGINLQESTKVPDIALTK
ncbi:4Fe-4S dicluster domain-containing protein [Candidatus Formimonas warabiya]|uniref:Oxidoreductase n=1 Tax=Formimonas warabiya TaxID=1761012 RepID=A0A3G1KWI1_FORW1|nr:4Fe-4S dicluster domain-containing protein [Candidatus Formimonas warabiya]ATW26806.1 oxidoreductase [Candidatus Formimonas warabiya]